MRRRIPPKKKNYMKFPQRKKPAPQILAPEFLAEKAKFLKRVPKGIISLTWIQGIESRIKETRNPLRVLSREKEALEEILRPGTADISRDQTLITFELDLLKLLLQHPPFLNEIIQRELSAFNVRIPPGKKKGKN
ncbi:MAG: hypothetical protein Q7K42_00535 [Candidatus Diapherotrites archaeon]|nr:hypothetical protein [Candidatus Diapherotrites archaeon]